MGYPLKLLESSCTVLFSSSDTSLYKDNMITFFLNWYFLYLHNVTIESLSYESVHTGKKI